MDLQEEYFSRKRVPAKLIKYVDRANLILKSKENNKDLNWLHVSIDMKQEANHPAHYNFVVSANPVIYASADFSHFSFHHTKILSENKWEWDQYESSLLEWIKTYSKDYVAVPASEAVFVSWEMFLANYDSWIANFLPYRVIDWLSGSLQNNNVDSRLQCIKLVEDWIKEKYDRVFGCWKNIRNQLDQKNYADWLAIVINGN